jgi:hypothetical protein
MQNEITADYRKSISKILKHNSPNGSSVLTVKSETSTLLARRFIVLLFSEVEKNKDFLIASMFATHYSPIMNKTQCYKMTR